MLRSTNFRLQFLVIIFVMISSTFITPTSGVVLDVSPSGFLLENGDILAFEVGETSENGVPGLTIELTEDDQNLTEVLEAGEEIAVRIEDLPDWGANTSELAVLGGATNGGHFTLEYPAPYIASGVVDDNGPAYFMPVITVGDDAYWNDFETVATTNNFTVTSNTTHFAMTQTTADAFIDVVWTKADGVLSFYHYEYNEEGIDKVLKLVRADWDIIISQASSLGFSTTNPLLDYTVTEAVSGDLNTAFNLSAINIEGGENGPQSADGILSVGQRIIVNVDNHRLEDEMGYTFNMEGESGYINFNTTIQLPDENPQANNMFLYPQFVVTDTDIIEGYLKAAEFISQNYSTFINNTHFGIDFDHENGTIDAIWELDTGFLTSWRLNNSEEGQILALDLIAGEDLEDFDINYNHVVPGDGNTYQFLQIDIDGEDDQLPLDEDENLGVGYIGEGDLVYVDPVMSALNLDDTPPTVFYNVNGTNGFQSNISISVEYPGYSHIEVDGPPLLFFHHLGGSEIFFNWVETLYDATGGSYDQNGTHIIMTFSNEDVEFEQIFRLSDLAMVYYYYENTADGVLLEIAHVSDTNIVVSNLTSSLSDISETPAGLALPMFDGLTGIALMAFFVAIPILKRRS